jgi:hypothetical protein
MSIEVAEFILASASNFQDDTVTTRVIQAQFTQEDDKQEVQQWRLSGFDSSPSPGVKGLIVDMGDGYKVSVAEKDGLTDSGLNPGERKVYSDLDGVLKAFVKFLNTGILELNGNADFAVRYTDLETAFNQLKADFDAHTHGGVTSGAAFTSAIAVGSTADITPAKITTVKVP